MTERLIIWLIVGPLLLAVVAPMIQTSLEQWRLPIHAIGHVLLLVSAVATFRLPAQAVVVTIRGAALGGQLSLDSSRPVPAELTLVAVLFLAISLACDKLARASRHGIAFLSLLAVAQTAANLTFLAGDLLALYGGLVILSLSITVMIGLDFSNPGRDAGLRVLATLEAPSAVALASFWLIDAQTGTVNLAAVPSRIQSLGPATALVLVLPILIAVIARAALAPLQHWVIVGSRAGAAPVAVTIAGLAVPLGGVAFARLVDVATLGNLNLLHALAVLAALSACLAGIGAFWETSALGVLAYLAMAQVSLAVVGFATPNPWGPAAGWLGLASGAIALTTLGLGLTAAIRAVRATDLSRLSPNQIGWPTTAALAVGSLALAPLPGFAAFAARTILVGSLVADGTNWGLVAGLLTILATFVVTASALRVPVALTRNYAPETVKTKVRSLPRVGKRARALAEALPREADELGNIGGVLVVLIILNALVGIVPVSWLGSLAGVSNPAPAAPLLTLAVTVVLGAVTIIAVRSFEDPTAFADHLPRGMTRNLRAFLQRFHPERAIDPYLVFGYLLINLGRLSAALLNNTLGRLARSG